ncbi:AraC family transcriptional regulator [Spirosoma aureum]|uniref:AraC family transcriptional regulator n=1 Tax=Spirosoma aureum TaxID=2692134 RepID=A0A6G9AIH2_9BACT|nr:helix-turn-helix domain-containing protein [Spirosoma aureum]QIP12075.1 AraC family transcriptional regulator [Spirosoma aureum]
MHQPTRMDTSQLIGLPISPIRIVKIESDEYKTVSYNRRDYYKISFITRGTGIMYFSGTRVDVDGPYLLFFNPLLSYSWQPTSAVHSGYTCLFTEEFFHNKEQLGTLARSALFSANVVPAYPVNEELGNELTALFEKLSHEAVSDYAYKEDVMRNYVSLILHEALKLQANRSPVYNLAAERLTDQFFKLMQAQFPIHSSGQRMDLKSPADYANALHVHVNHLNHSIQQVTGKPTIQHIQGRVANEARMLLHYTDWPVADIAFCLGFEYATYFNRFFKKQTGHTPATYRKMPV